MTIPSTLQIGGHSVRVVLEPREKNMGEWVPLENTIYIDSRQPQSQQEITLIHEVLHVINGRLDATELGHIFLDSFAEQLYAALKNNDLLK